MQTSIHPALGPERVDQTSSVHRVLFRDVSRLRREVEIQLDLRIAFSQFEKNFGIELRNLRERHV